MGLFRKCPFCKQRDNLSKITKWNSYEDEYYYYHPSCLLHVLRNPESYNHRTVDLALDIDQCLQMQARKRSDQLARAANR